MANHVKPKYTESAGELPVKQTLSPAATPVTAESVYTADELAANHKVFGTHREIVVVALRRAGKKSATFSEAKNIIENFREEVK